MKEIFSLFFGLIIGNSFAQIAIDNTTYNTTQLVDGILVPATSGTIISNVTYQGVYNQGGEYQVGHFSTTGSTQLELGFTDGVVLTTGNTSQIPLALGVNPGSVAQMSRGYFSSVPGEIRQSLDYILDLDILAGAQNYFNASILEFDFIPLQNFVQFRYVFGSEEYMDDGGFINYQCTDYNDKFGFLISGPGIAGGEGYTSNAENIARLANGSEVGINSVNNGIVGSSAVPNGASYCTSENPNWIQNVSTAEYAGTIDGTQLNGNTIALTAYKGGLTPGQTYHIKLIVTDVNDGGYDAVVYLEAGSFITENPCTPPSNPTASVTVQPTCTTPTGTIVATLPVLGTNEVYEVTGTSPAVAAITNTTGTFASLAPGAYAVTVLNTVTGCESSVTTLTVNAVPSAPVAPTASVTVQPTCTTPTGTIVATLPVLGTNEVYEVTGTSPVVAAVTNTTGTFASLAPGAYAVTVLNTVTGCESLVNALTVNAVPGAPVNPTASVTVQPDCTTPTGTIVVTAPLGAGLEYSIGGAYQTSTTFSGLAPGDYDVTVQNTSTSCISGASTVTVNTVPVAPTDPTASVTDQPDCTTPTGTIVVSAPLGAGLEYSIGGAYQTSTTFSGLAPGDYDVTVQNTSTSCISGAITLTVNAVPTAPVTPTASVTVQPTCTTPTGTIVATLPVLGTNEVYEVTGTSPVVAAVTNTTGTFASLAPGAYAVTVLNTVTGCESSVNALTVNAVPGAPVNPTASVTVQPDCTTPTGTIVVTAPLGAGLEYSIGGAYQTSTTFSGLAPGDYDVTVQNTSTSCISGATTVTVNAIPGAPANPTGSVTVQPDCTTPTGTIVVTAPLGAGLEYSIGGAYQTSTTFSGLAPGDYDVTVQNTSTSCISGATTLTVNAVPVAPTAPTGSVTVQPDCTTPTGTIVVTAPLGAGLEYSIGGAYQTSTTFSGLTPGSYNLTVQNTSTSCISGATTVTVNAVPVAESVQILENSQSINLGETITLNAIGNGNMTWSNGITGSSITVTPENSTEYCVELIDANGCTDSDCILIGVNIACGELFVPSAFSPDGNGLNEGLKPMINPECVNYMVFRVFDRWGELVYETDDINAYWDGNYKGKELPTGAYVYTLKIKLSSEEEEQLLSGNVELYR